MHDWILHNVQISWDEQKIIMEFKSPEKLETVRIIGFSKAIFPRQNQWGESVSVNGTIGPMKLENGQYRFQIEMQSGDVIEVEAEEIILPKF